MIAKISRGGQATGLMSYLVGPGRSNEHERPHLVAASPGLMSWYSTEELSHSDAAELGRFIEGPNRQYGTAVKKVVNGRDQDGGVVVTGDRRDAHVWHCSLSLAPDHEPINDETWGVIANDFVEAMDFVVQDERGRDVKAPCRWVAVHHGTSVNGGDHIHLAVNLVRDDGTKASTSHDYRRASKAVAAIEAKYGLEQVAGREANLLVRDENVVERLRAERNGQEHVAPVELAHRVRSAAVASTTEDEWIRRCRKADVVLKPRYARGSTDVVVGYQAALKTDGRERLLFYGGQKLGKDLSLPRVRELFDSPTIEQADAAAAEWQAAAKGQPPVGSGREAMSLKSEASVKAAESLAEQADKLAGIDPNDHAAWGDVARDASGALSSWARFDPDNREDLNAAARQVARSAQIRRRGVPHRSPRASTSLVAAVMLQAQTGGKGKVAGVLLLRQLMATVQAVHDRHVQMGHAGEARMMREHAIGRLQKVSTIGYGSELMGSESRSTTTAVLEAQRIASALHGDGNTTAAAGQGKPGPDGPLPRPLGPGRQRSGARDRDDRGHER